jgi:hypothetical protein
VVLVIAVMIILSYTSGQTAHGKAARIRDLANALEASER